MDDAVMRQLKAKLLQDVLSWDQSERGFQDIVRNVIDIDKKILRDLMRAFSADFKEVRAWGAGSETPDHFNRQAIVAKIHELLIADPAA